MSDNNQERTKAFLFPGHGVQEKDMGKAIYSSFRPFVENVRALDNAHIVPFNLEEVIHSGSESVFSDEVISQVMIFVVNAGYDLVLRHSGIQPSFVYGYSSGIYSAFVASGALSLADGLKLVYQAGKLMTEYLPEGQFGMIAVTGLRHEVIEGIIAQCESFGTITIANTNSDRQFFLSGDRETLVKAMTLCRQPGLLNVRFIPVHIPYHSPIVQEAATMFSKIVDQIHINDPHIPAIEGATGTVIRRGTGVSRVLMKQLVAPVNFPLCVETLLKLGVQEFWEVGYSSFLKQLLRRYRQVEKIYEAKTWFEKSQTLR